MSMGPVSDYSLGKARYQELEAEVRQNARREEMLGQIGLTGKFIVWFGILSALVALGIQLS